MSYNIAFKAKIEGVNQYISVGYCDANITWNVRKIIMLSTGLPWKNEANNGFMRDVIPSIERGWKELSEHPEKYAPYESPNGWGTVEDTKNFFERIMRCWDDFCGEYDEEIVNVTVFWIE